MANKNHTTVRSTATTYFPIAGAMYRAGKSFDSFYIENTQTNTSKTFTAETTYRWYLRTLVTAGEQVVKYWRASAMMLYIAARSTQPLPPVISSVAAVQHTSKREHTVNIPTRTVGQFYNAENAADLSAAFNNFTTKYGVEPNVIRINTNHIPECRSTKAVPYTRNDSTPRGKVVMLYVPTDESAVA